MVIIVAMQKAYLVTTDVIPRTDSHKAFTEVTQNTEQSIGVTENFGNEVIIFYIPDSYSKEDTIIFATALDQTNETDYIPFSFWTMHTIAD